MAGRRRERSLLYRCTHPRARSPGRENVPAQAAAYERKEEEDSMAVTYQQRKMDGERCSYYDL